MKAQWCSWIMTYMSGQGDFDMVSWSKKLKQLMEEKHEAPGAHAKDKNFSSNLFSYHPSFGAHSGSIALHGPTGSSNGSHCPWNFGAKVGHTTCTQPTSQLCVCKSMTCNHHWSSWGTCSMPNWQTASGRPWTHLLWQQASWSSWLVVLASQAWKVFWLPSLEPLTCSDCPGFVWPWHTYLAQSWEG